MLLSSSGEDVTIMKSFTMLLKSKFKIVFTLCAFLFMTLFYFSCTKDDDGVSEEETSFDLGRLTHEEIKNFVADIENKVDVRSKDGYSEELLFNYI